MLRLGNPSARHLYQVEVWNNERGCVDWIEVDANDRAHAGRIAARNDYVVRSVNMVG
jgi:hypothetical protein